MPLTLSILITAAHEPQTIGAALEAFLKFPPPGLLETLVVCPDEATARAASRYPDRGVRALRDAGRGKPAALNLGLAEARGDLIVFSDGDVTVDPANWTALLEPFAAENVGAATGRPVSLSSRSAMLGYWSHVLTEAGAHAVRLELDRAGAFLLCSGYLYAIRRRLAASIPEDALAEDAVISLHIHALGRRIRYVPQARVYVKYPTSYADWVRQKRRSLAGYAQEYVRGAVKGGRSFRTEFGFGAVRALRYARGPKELVWTGLLFLARAHVWLQAHLVSRVLRRPLAEVWERVESTK